MLLPALSLREVAVALISSGKSSYIYIDSNTGYHIADAFHFRTHLREDSAYLFAIQHRIVGHLIMASNPVLSISRPDHCQPRE